MILTPLKIQIAIIKAWYSIALKSVKYYAGLAVGINNSCLLKQARLLRKYVEILRNFTIVGSTIECSCCIEGDYTVLLNDLSEATEANIQFGCDNEGYLVFNGNSYPFTYIYDPSNNTLKIDFLDVNDNPINMNLLDIQFTSECNITNTNDLITPNAGSQLEVSTVTVTGTPITVENEYGDWSGTLEVRDDADDPLYTLTIPASILSDPQAIVDLWNTTYGNTGWLLYYNGTSYIMTTPLENNEFFTDYKVVFTQYEEPVNDSDAEFPFFASMGFEFPAVQNETLASAIIEIPTSQFTLGNPATMQIDVNGFYMFDPSGSLSQEFIYDGNTMYTHTGGTFATQQDLVDDFNANNGLGFVMSYDGPSPTPGNFLFTIITTTNSTSYNGNQIEINYGVGEPDAGTFSGGVNPTTGYILMYGYNLNYYSNYPFSTVQEFVDDFNLNNNNNNVGYTAEIVGTSGGNTLVKFTAPGAYVYNGQPINYSHQNPTYLYSTTYSGGVDTTVGTLTINLLDSSDNFISQLYQDLSPQNYTTVNELFGRLNTSPNNMNFYYIFSITGNIFNSPVNSFAYYEGYKIQITYDYESEQYEDVDITRTLDDGVDPTQQTYEAFFQVDGNTGTFINDNPCEVTIAEQECLSNKQVSDIIKHINKLVR